MAATNENDKHNTATPLSLSLSDPRAYYAVGNATAAVTAGGTCARLCSYSDELAPADAPCCGGDLWLPSLRFRNIVSLSGGRDQIFQITVTVRKEWRKEGG